MEEIIPEYINIALDKLSERGYRAYIVGGAVRDYCLKKEPVDFDITTDASPDEIIDVFKDFKTIDIGKEYGTIVVNIGENNIEITSFRIDLESQDGRKPKGVIYTKNLEMDLKRRDFTINSMAFNKDEGLIDLFNGLEDLNMGIIRTIGKPSERFSEDYLRVLRCIRFSASLDFTIEEETWKECINNRYGLGDISPDRIREEFFKILLSDKPSKGIRLLRESGILPMIIPELEATYDFYQQNPYHNKDVFNHILDVVDNIEPVIHLRLAALLHDIGKPRTFTIDEDDIGHFYGHDKLGSLMSREILERLNTPRYIIDKVELLIRRHMALNGDIARKGIKKLMNIFGEDIEDLFKITLADSKGSKNIDLQVLEEDLNNKRIIIQDILQGREVYNKRQMNINGRDLINIGYKEGVIVGQILDYLYELVLEDKDLNDIETLINIAKEEFPLG